MRLRDRPTSTGKPSILNAPGEVVEQRRVVLEGLAEAEPRIEQQPIIFDRFRRISQAATRSPRKLPHLFHHVVVLGCILHCARLASHVHQAHRQAEIRPRLRARRSATQRTHVVEQVTPAATACAASPPPCWCRLESMVSSRRQAFLDDGHHALDTPSSTLTGSDPGRVDSPPTSMNGRSIREHALSVRQWAASRSGIGHAVGEQSQVSR